MTRTSFYSRAALTSALLLSVSVLTACSDPSASAEGAAAGGMPPASVNVLTVKQQSVPLLIETPALLAGSREVEIRARVSGIVEKRNFNEGAKVEAEQSLFSLDAATFEATVNRNKAELAAAQARQAQAERTLKRLDKLRKDGAVSQQSLDDALSAVDVAKADVKTAEAILQQAQVQLNYTEVRSPISGVVSRELVSEGSLVSGPEVLLTYVTQLDPMYVRFSVAERDQLRLRAEAQSGKVDLPKQWQVKVLLANGDVYDQTGIVDFSDVRINTQTGTSEMKAEIANPDALLRPGQFVRIQLEGAVRHNAIVVPQKAVLDGGTGKFVYVMADGEHGGKVAMPAPVEVGEWVKLNGENGWVIKSGLKDGDVVIVEGMARIFFPGMPVQLAQESATKG
ncbi:efflux RND transporter periplasmic adaptor subunit [Rheinheimera aquimaris]|jgi:membrane fusion protein (multidrug efflux system)|uniref:efflux RND transporter periplasmic adaptor subunit n=2 Tax=Rheinheimera aquimaris TaxID=412437 RepID=UPI001064D145|nr:efflux RND transporter periplasmic adaptor subunit [Rheinheimera aquimaris]MCD1599103.1 efflux RND transporter periplasmic adaptor subunit [Rheinheimera aquimaris]|tara:strand:- start:399 stop:1586 length:1188 start_codon:yes stop_codon:yes gene_type:complete